MFGEHRVSQVGQTSVVLRCRSSPEVCLRVLYARVNLHGVSLYFSQFQNFSSKVFFIVRSL